MLRETILEAPGLLLYVVLTSGFRAKNNGPPSGIRGPAGVRIEISVPFLVKAPIMAQNCATGSDFLDFGTEAPY